MIELFLFFLYNFLICFASIFLVYFTKCYRSMVWFYLQKIQNQLKGKRNIRNNSGLCKCSISSQTSINVNWEIQHVSMLCKPNISSQICCTKVCLDGHSNMLELDQWGFLSWCTQKILSPSSFAYGPRVFRTISKERMLWCVVLLPI